MKRLRFYLIKSFIGPFVLTFFICIFVLLMQFLWRYLDDLVGKGLETSIIIELISYASISLVPMALILAVLLSSIMTFGNLGERFELLAIKAAGISLLNFMKPLVVLCALISLFAYFLANDVVPVTNTKFYALLYSVKSQRPEMIIKEGVFSNELDGYSIKVARRNMKTNALEEIIIYDHTEGKGNINVTLADSGYLKMTEDKQYMILTLFNGERYTEAQTKDKNVRDNNNPFRREKFKKEVIVIKMDGMDLKRADEDHFRDMYKMQKNKQLGETIDSLMVEYHERERVVAVASKYTYRLDMQVANSFLADSMKAKIRELPEQRVVFDSIWNNMPDSRKKVALASAQQLVQANQRILLQFENDLVGKLRWINKHSIEWHRKYSLSIACLIFLFIGAPLGAIIHKGGFGMPVVVSILMFILYYLVSMIGEKVAREGVWSVGTAMWASTALFLPLGVFLTYKAVTDSLMFTPKSYAKIKKRLNNMKSHIFKKIKKAKKDENSGSVQ